MISLRDMSNCDRSTPRSGTVRNI